MKRKIFIASIVFAILSILILPQTIKAATLSLFPSSGSFEVGQTFNVSIILDTQATNTDGVDIYYLNYDPSLLEVQDADSGQAGVQINPGSLFSNTVSNSVDTTNGKIDFSQTSSGGNYFNGTGTVANITFKVLSQGTANITFDFTLGTTTDTNVDAYGVDILSDVVNGSYVLSLPDCTDLGGKCMANPCSNYQSCSSLAGECSSGYCCSGDCTTGGGGGGGGGGGSAPSGDTTPPSISDVKITKLATTSTTISWNTSEPSISWILYGTTTDYGLEIKTTTSTTSHSLTLTGLSASTTYHYQIKSKDSSGNIGSYTDKTFTTLALGEPSIPTPSGGPGSSISTTTPTSSQMTVEQLKEKIRQLLALIAQLKARLAELLSSRISGISGIPTGFSFQKDLFLGITDQDVVYLKIVLKKEGCLSGVKNTKWFGPKTRKAVQCFCRKYKDEISRFAGYPVRCSGFVGRGIRMKLNQLLGR